MAKTKTRTLKSWKRKLERCNKYYQSHGYYYNSNPRKKGGKSINCCGFPFRALYHYGVIPKECIYAYTKHGRLKGQGASKIKKLCEYKIIDMPFDEAEKKGLIKPGDIIGYSNGAHTEVYKGRCTKGGERKHKFYNYNKRFRQTNGVAYRPLSYDRPVGCVIRIKGLVYKSASSKKTAKKPTAKTKKKTGAQLRAEMVKTAESYMGVKQGSKEHKEIVDRFNEIKPDGWAMTYSAPWCACFSSAVAMIAFGNAKAKKYFPLSANCGTIITKAKKMGIWKEADDYKPKEGDWVLYDWDDSGYGNNHGSPDHVGVVEKVSGNQIAVVEGNKSTTSQVGRRYITRGQMYIRGYVTPKYDAMAKEM